MFTRLRARLDRLAVLALVLLGCGLCAALYVVLKPVPPGPAPNETRSAAEGETSSGPASLTEAELAVVWAGRDPARPKPNAAPESAARPAQGDAFPFKVRGVIYSTSGTSVAFIESSSGLALYRIGQLLDGWQISSIARNAVTFTRDGKERTIPMAFATYSNRPAYAAAPRPAPTRPRTTRHRTRRPITPVAPPGSPGRRLAPAVADRSVSASAPRVRPPPLDPSLGKPDATVAIPQKVVELARTNPEALVQGVNLSRLVGKKGLMQGIRINKVARGSLAARYGLAPGDRILAVNGQALDSPARALQLYQRYRNSKSVMVTLERNGQRKKIQLYAY